MRLALCRKVSSSYSIPSALLWDNPQAGENNLSGVKITVLSLNGNSVEFDTGDVWTGGISHCPPCDREFARDDDGDGFCEVHVNTYRGLLVLAAVVAPALPGDLQEKLLASEMCPKFGIVRFSRLEQRYRAVLARSTQSGLGSSRPPS
jgi:hypothetical protein